MIAEGWPFSGVGRSWIGETTDKPDNLLQFRRSDERGGGRAEEGEIGIAIHSMDRQRKMSIAEASKRGTLGGKRVVCWIGDDDDRMRGRPREGAGLCSALGLLPKRG